MARTLLFLSAENFQAYLWNGKGLTFAHEFSNDADGREQFSSFLEQNHNPTYLLVDIIEEDFHLETIPHLIGPSRSALIERKFEQYYRSTPFRQATLLKRQEEGRRDDDYLFSALTNPQRITPWLDALLENHVPLAGIYSIPNISAPLLKDIQSEHILLLTWERNAGLRQTYFHNKRLHFSRLIPINENGTLIEAIISETPRTQQYLKSLSLPPPGEVLEVYILCHANEIAQLSTKLSSDGEQHFNYLDITEFARKHKCKQEIEDSDSTALFLNLLAGKPPSAHYANSAHTHFFMLWQLRFVLFGLAIFILLLGLMWGGMAFWQSEQFSSETKPLLKQTAQLQTQAQGIQRNFANTSVPAADMKTAVLLARSLNQYSHPPQGIIYELSAVLESFPRITLNELAWQASPADAAPTPYPAQVITFEGTLSGFGSDHRGALAYLEKFEQALIRHGYAVSATALPLDITSKGSISGQSADASQGQFTLKIIWRVPS
ncbi:MAG: hypothetical protein KJ850_07520 [Gammaproteobacteria bacterium]|nr:hypothetical protein [Gammaproteobacteria bacterium]MBU1624884.1 hypothetical protein [Gammaproteobacteria bacterium]MBU1982728.1 hypothetical protein [Gammaproteobacteria bacterium]